MEQGSPALQEAEMSNQTPLLGARATREVLRGM